MFVYLIQNTVNGKCYVGQTVQKLQRYFDYNVRCALRGSEEKPALYAAIRKYGKDAFTIRIISTFAEKAEMDKAERAYIVFFGTRSRKLGYNLTDGGDGTIGAERTAEWKANISKGNTGKKFSEERKQAMSLARKGTVLTAETKAKIGQALKGRKASPLCIEKLIARNKARRIHPEIKPIPQVRGSWSKGKPCTWADKISAAQKGRVLSAERRAALSASQRGKKKPERSPEHRAKISANKKLWWANKKQQQEELNGAA